MKNFLNAIGAGLLAGAVLCSSICAFAEDGETVKLENTKNVALGSEVYVDSTYSNSNIVLSFFSAEFLTDGEWPEFDQVSQEEVPIGWYAQIPEDELSDDSNYLNIEIDLGGKYTIDTVKVYPMKFLPGYNVPGGYDIQVSADGGKNWTTVASVEKTGATPTTNDALVPYVSTFDPIAANEVRIVITDIGGFTGIVEEVSYRYVGLGEVEVMGVDGDIFATPTPTPTATPEPTEVPTAAPEATSAPAENTSSSETGATSSGCGSVISGGAIIVTLLGAALVIRKKH